MQQLGYTRSSCKRDHLLLTADTFVRAPLPGMQNATAIVHVSPAAGAAFTQYTVEFEPGGSMAPSPHQRFLFVLDGAVTIGAQILAAGQFAYLAPDHPDPITAASASRAAVIEKTYRPLPGVTPPALLIGNERDIAPTPLNGDPDLQVRALIPACPAFDFAVNTMEYQPGAALSMVEIHVMEHGLLMLAGGGIYRLGDCWYPVTAGDFIWMAPYCPQWFGALGKTPAKYLIYKDWNRHPL
jgi:(S)-ureidoglycine aminohydrolase